MKFFGSEFLATYSKISPNFLFCPLKFSKKHRRQFAILFSYVLFGWILTNGFKFCCQSRSFLGGNTSFYLGSKNLNVRTRTQLWAKLQNWRLSDSCFYHISSLSDRSIELACLPVPLSSV